MCRQQEIHRKVSGEADDTDDKRTFPKIKKIFKHTAADKIYAI